MTEEVAMEGISEMRKSEQGHGKMLERGNEYVTLARQFSHMKTGRVVAERGEITAQFWADCHLRQWAASEMALP